MQPQVRYSINQLSEQSPIPNEGEINSPRNPEKRTEVGPTEVKLQMLQLSEPKSGNNRSIDGKILNENPYKV